MSGGKFASFAITGTSPAAAGRAVIGKPFGGMEEFRDVGITMQLVGATGGTLDIVLQRQVDTNPSLWADWIRAPSLAAGAAAIKYVAASSPAAAPVVVGTAVDDIQQGAGPALAAGAIAHGPLTKIRAVAIAGVGTTAGAAIDIRISCTRPSW